MGTARPLKKDESSSCAVIHTVSVGTADPVWKHCGGRCTQKQMLLHVSPLHTVLPKSQYTFQWYYTSHILTVDFFINISMSRRGKKIHSFIHTFFLIDIFGLVVRGGTWWWWRRRSSWKCNTKATAISLPIPLTQEFILELIQYSCSMNPVWLLIANLCSELMNPLAKMAK